MTLLDEVLDFLHYHPHAKRTDVEQGIAAKVSPAATRDLAELAATGAIVAEGNVEHRGSKKTGGYYALSEKKGKS